MSYISGFDSRLDENILSVYPNNCVMLSARKITQPYTTKRKTTVILTISLIDGKSLPAATTSLYFVL